MSAAAGPPKQLPEGAHEQARELTEDELAHVTGGAGKVQPSKTRLFEIEDHSFDIEQNI